MSPVLPSGHAAQQQIHARFTQSGLCAQHLIATRQAATTLLQHSMWRLIDTLGAIKRGTMVGSAEGRRRYFDGHEPHLMYRRPNGLGHTEVGLLCIMCAINA